MLRISKWPKYRQHTLRALIRTYIKSLKTCCWFLSRFSCPSCAANLPACYLSSRPFFFFTLSFSAMPSESFLDWLTFFIGLSRIRGWFLPSCTLGLGWGTGLSISHRPCQQCKISRWDHRSLCSWVQDWLIPNYIFWEESVENINSTFTGWRYHAVTLQWKRFTLIARTHQQRSQWCIQKWVAQRIAAILLLSYWSFVSFRGKQN